jgi:DNA-directed RNA polymerase specialized sigma24 family protein
VTKREPAAPLMRLSDVTALVATRAETDVRSVVTEQIRPDFAVFYRTAYQDVARALAVTLGDADLGREAADEAMARCYSRWGVVQGYDNPAGWVYRVGLNWARSLRRRAACKLFFHHTPVEMPPVADPEIQRAVAELSIELRAVVVLRFLLDWSTQETADALAVRPGTVKSRLHRATALLQRKLYHLAPEEVDT